jgi:TatD DNase family protein
MLIQHGAKRVLLHAFDGKRKYVEAGVAAGFFFSVPPSVVRESGKNAVLEVAPLTALVLETDSPALAAVKGARNEPREIWTSCRAVAACKGITEQEVALTTSENAARLFPRAFL